MGHYPFNSRACRRNGLLSREPRANRTYPHAAEVEPGRMVEVAGLVITRQRPESASGALFMTLEDETGHVDISLSEKIFLRFQNVVRLSPALRIRGVITADGRARNVSALLLAPLRFERSLRVDAHDFR